tara:strand:+ start:480 stop:866 length:387 start_codon:yes stop_codon:yes gene_type:complete
MKTRKIRIAELKHLITETLKEADLGKESRISRLEAELHAEVELTKGAILRKWSDRLNSRFRGMPVVLQSKRLTHDTEPVSATVTDVDVYDDYGTPAIAFQVKTSDGRTIDHVAWYDLLQLGDEVLANK